MLRDVHVIPQDIRIGTYVDMLRRYLNLIKCGGS